MNHPACATALLLALSIALPVRAEPTAPPTAPATTTSPTPAPAAGPETIEAELEGEGNAAALEPLPLDELRAFTEVYAKIKADYVEEVSDKDLLNNAIKGMLAGLDPHSSYLDPEGFQGLQEGTSGEFGGLGLEVGVEDGIIRVISPIDDTPAAKAGLQPGDLLLKIDDTPTKDMALNDAVKLMRGRAGTPIRLTIGREGTEKPFEVTLTRDVIRVRSVRHEVLDPGFGYVRISNFQNRTGEDLRLAIEKLQTEAKGLKGLVLDLRNNPGGVLGAAVEVSDLLLEKGRIVYTDGRVKDATLEFDAKPGDALRGAPLVVLINGGSASASEIVAGALQDHRRGVIMGSQSFGKGSVQTILPMQNDAALKLTTARYYTPSGRSIQAQGITPDIALDALVIAEAPEGSDAGIKEADLSGHLNNPGGTTPPAAEPAPTPATPPEVKDKAEPDQDAASNSKPNSQLAQKDYAINEALTLLKGMALLGKPSPVATTSPPP
jgi:carboxyl-terminal processing protease